jgi:hypothetical protein
MRSGMPSAQQQQQQQQKACNEESYTNAHRDFQQK